MGVSQQDLFDRALGALHDAMLDDARWPAATALFDAACGMSGSALTIGRGPCRNVGNIHWVQFCCHGQRDMAREQMYFGTYYAHDEHLPRLAALPDGRLAKIADLYTPEERKHSAAYNEALPLGGYLGGLTVRMNGPDGLSIVWGLTDSIELGGWTSSQIRLARELLPYIRQFASVRYTLAAVNAVGASFAALLENRGVAVIHLDQEGRIVEVNDRARDILLQGDALQDGGGLLRARERPDNDRLSDLLARALPRFGSQPVGGSMAVRRVSRKAGLVLHVHPVGDTQTHFGAAGTAVLILVTDALRGPDIDPHLVASTLGLTPAETRVAVALATGRSVRDIAIVTGRQENTVRFHLKEIYRKQGIGRQAELVRLVHPLVRTSGPQS